MKYKTVQVRKIYKERDLGLIIGSGPTSSFVLKHFPQTSHLNSLTPVCLKMCSLQNARGQSGQSSTGVETTWLGVGHLAWKKIMHSNKLHMKKDDKMKRRVWLFGDSILRGIGREIDSLSRGHYEVIDKCKSGANIRDIRRNVIKNFSELESDDLVVIGGGGNRLEEIGEQKTVHLLENMVTILKGKVKQSPLIMCIPMRRRNETRRFGTLQRKVNREYVKKLEEWACDGLQLWEGLDWNEVWGRDGIHLSNVGKVWLAWNLVE